MIILVLSCGIAALLLCAGLGAYLIAEAVRRKTERSIAVFYRDKPLECTMMLNRISLKETRREIALQKQLMGEE